MAPDRDSVSESVEECLPKVSESQFRYGVKTPPESKYCLSCTCHDNKMRGKTAKDAKFSHNYSSSLGEMIAEILILLFLFF